MDRVSQYGPKNKKLIEAAEYWAGNRETDETIEDLKVLGAPAEIIKKAQEELEEKPFLILPCNWDSISHFLKLATQWNRGPTGGLVGLNYQSAEFLFKLEGTSMKKARPVMQDVRVMEVAVLNYLDKQKGGKS